MLDNGMCLYDSLAGEIFIEGPMITIDMGFEKRGGHSEDKLMCRKTCFLYPLRCLIFNFDDQVMKLGIVEMFIKLPLMCNYVLRVRRTVMQLYLI